MCSAISQNYEYKYHEFTPMQNLKKKMNEQTKGKKKKRGTNKN